MLKICSGNDNEGIFRKFRWCKKVPYTRMKMMINVKKFYENVLKITNAGK
jgi:hypothetical protein